MRVQERNLSEQVELTLVLLNIFGDRVKGIGACLQFANQLDVILLHSIRDAAVLVFLPSDEIKDFGAWGRLMFDLADVSGSDAFDRLISHFFGAGE